MASFIDEFSRANYNRLGNNWKLQAKKEGSSVPADAWEVYKGGGAPKGGGIGYVAYRANPYPAGANVQFIWHVKPPAASVWNNNAECIFRYTATGGLKRERLAVVLIGANGYLQRRYWGQTEATQTQITLASWARNDTADYTITVDVSAADLITVYDTNYTGVGTKAAELTSAVQSAHTGAGMGSGYFNRFVLNDLSNPTYAIFTADSAKARIKVDCQFEVNDPEAGDYPDAVQYKTGLTVDPYVVLDGLPVDVVGLQAALSTVTMAALVTNDTGVAPDPAAVGTGATVRWLATAGSFSSTTWSPTSGAGLTISHADALDPVLDSTFQYTSPLGLLERKAVVFKGGTDAYTSTYMRVTGGGSAAAPWTLSLACLLRSGEEAYYEVLASDPAGGGAGTPLKIIYRHGMIYVELGARVITHETARNDPTPTIITLAVKPDGDKSLGRVLIQDRRRTYKEFSMKSGNMAPRFTIGAFPDTPGTEKPHAQMALFEVDYWDSFQPGTALLRHNNLLSHVYGVIR